MNWKRATAVLILVGLSLVGTLAYLKKTQSPYYPQKFLNESQNMLYSLTESTYSPELEQIKLELSPHTVEHLRTLHDQYENGPGGLAYYQEHNQWHRGVLIYGGKKYRIKIKSHGQAPFEHRTWRYVSLNIKLRDGRSLWGVKKFRLIVYERVTQNADIAQFFSQEFELIEPFYRLVQVKINHWRPKLYFIEKRVESRTFETMNLTEMRHFGRETLVASQTRGRHKTFSKEKTHELAKKTLDLANQKITESLKNNPKLSDDARTAIRKRYLTLNQMIIDRDHSHFEDFFDLDYISRFEAARLIAGYWGHGSYPWNLEVLYNSTNGKFYPVLHRDYYMGPLEDPLHFERELSIADEYWIPQKKELETVEELSFVQYLSQYEPVRLKKYQLAHQWFTSDDKIEYAKRWTQNHLARHQNTSPFYRLYQGTRRLIKSLLSMKPKITDVHYNRDFLLRTFNHTPVVIEQDRNPRQIRIRIEPQSLVHLGISKIQIPFKNSADQAELNFKVSAHASDYHHNASITLPPDAPAIELASSLKKLIIHQALDQNSYPMDRPVMISLTAPEGVQFMDSPIGYGLHNLVTRQPVPAQQISIRSGLQREWQLASSEAKLVKPSLRSEIPFEIDHQKKLILWPAGNWTIREDLKFPRGYHLRIPEGVTIFISDKKSVLVREGNLKILGTRKNPVIIRGHSKAPFGAFVASGSGKEEVLIRHLQISHGHEAWVDGAYYSGALSLYNLGQVEILDSKIFNHHADDGLNIKKARVSIVRSEFFDNFADQIDLDFCEGEVLDSRFWVSDQSADHNGDGLDLSGSKIIVQNSSFEGFRDKGLSIGEDTLTWLQGNLFKNCHLGIASKDASRVFVANNYFEKNDTDISIYQKKDIFSGARVTLLETPLKKRPKQFSILVDRHSQACVDSKLSAFPGWPTLAQVNCNQIYEASNIIADDWRI